MSVQLHSTFCPHCETKLAFREKPYGSSVRCKNCLLQFTAQPPLEGDSTSVAIEGSKKKPSKMRYAAAVLIFLALTLRVALSVGRLMTESSPPFDPTNNPQLEQIIGEQLGEHFEKQREAEIQKVLESAGLDHWEPLLDKAPADANSPKDG